MPFERPQFVPANRVGAIGRFRANLWLNVFSVAIATFNLLPNDGDIMYMIHHVTILLVPSYLVSCLATLDDAYDGMKLQPGKSLNRDVV